MGRRLYVGNLSFEVNQKDLEQLFSQAGVCESAAVVTDRATGQSRGFGFVEMGSNADAQNAIQQFNGYELKGRAMNVSEAREREESRGGGGGRGGHRGGGGGGGGGGRGGWGRRY
jgi:cold-inducible RNA-binding protein